MTQTMSDRDLKLDRMRYVKNTVSSRLCYLAILLNVLFFISIYKSDVGSWYYQILVGGSIVYNLLFMLMVFLASEGVKNYKTSYSWLMLGLGETDEEIVDVMRDLRAAGVQMLTIGQYLAPSSAHLPVRRYATPEEFAALERTAREMGFTSAAVAPLVRSSYHADLQAAQHARAE